MQYKRGHYARINNPSYKGQLAWNRGLKTNKPAWNKGIPYTQEQKNNISAKNKGNHYAAGHIVTPEARLQISEKHKGRTSWNKGIKTGRPASNRGKHHTPIAKLKIANRPYFSGKENANFGHLDRKSVV